MIRKPPISYTSMIYECGKPNIFYHPQFKKKHNPVMGVVYGIGFNTWLKFTKCGKLGNPWTKWRFMAWEKPHAPHAPWHRRVHIVYIHLTNTCWGYGGFCRVSQWMRTSYTTNQQEDFLSLIHWNSHHWTLTTYKTTECGRGHAHH